MKVQEITRSAAFLNAPLPTRKSLWGQARAYWAQLVQAGKRRPKSLRLCESLSLGERRFVAVIAYEQSRFLIGGTSGSLALLARLGNRTGTTTAREDNLQPDSSVEPLP